MTRVIHTGDTHVGYQQYHSPARREDFRRAFQAVVDDAVDADVDAVVHAGDLFHDRRPDLPDLMGVLSALRTLDDADIPFLAVVGNHEATRTGEWLDLFTEMGLARRLGASPVEVGDVAFYGLDWVPKSRREDLDYEFEACDCEHTALVAHGLFTPFQHGEWNTDELLDASNVAFGAMLLGDNHKPETAQVGDAWVTYCGSTERASASEREPRGYNLVTFDADAETAVDIRRRSLDTRPFVFVSVDLADGEGVERVREQVRQHDLADAVCIVEITGEGESVTPAAVEDAAAEEGALLVRVTDRREISEETELQVTFADPDDAVRERVAELRLSPAARDVDETVRASKTADSNVREAVEDRVTELLNDGESAFDPAAATDEPELRSLTERTSPGEETRSVAAASNGTESTNGPEALDETPADGATSDDGPSATDGSGSGDEATGDETSSGDEVSSNEDAPASESRPDESQGTMEDFL